MCGGKTRYNVERINELVTGCFSLARVDDWPVSLANRMSRWIGKPFMDALRSVHPNTPWPRTFLVDDFVDVLLQFFGDVPTECWIIEGDIKNELYLHWGGCEYDDFFFDSNGRFYHLHFDLCD
jgi:hypothetical protein